MPPVRVAIIDSGVHADHPHVGGVAGGIAIGPDGAEHGDYVDRIGHGTAVAAVIREKAPEAELYVIKVFDERLSTRVETLVHAIDWAARHDIGLVNLSLGTEKPEYEAILRDAVGRARAHDVTLVAACEDAGVRWLPGSLPGVVPVLLDWECPRDESRTVALPDGRKAFAASGYPRPIPGIPPERNLKGISFAVANVTGLLARRAGLRPAGLPP